MKPERLASLFIHGAERAIRGNSMTYTLGLAGPLDRNRVAQSYKRFVLARPKLRVKFVERPDASGFHWVPLSTDETEELLRRALNAMSTNVSREEADNRYLPSNQALPVTFTFLDDSTMVLDVNHVFTNGIGGLYWLRDWWGFYTRQESTEPDPPTQAFKESRGGVRRLLASFLGYVFAVTYILRFLFSAGRGAGTNTVDLTFGRTTASQANGYHVVRAQLDPMATEQVQAVAAKHGRTINRHYLACLAEALFHSQPEKQRVCISIPCDFQRYDPGLDRREPGNPTGSLIVQLFRNKPVDAQMDGVFNGLKQGVPFYLAKILAAFGNERAARDRFASQVETSISSRAPFENYSAALSLVGQVHVPEMKEELLRLSGHTKTQTIFIGVGLLNRECSIEASAPNDLFEQRDVEALIGDFVARLTTARR